MTTLEIANRLAVLCRDVKFETAQHELYAADAISIETVPAPGYEKKTKGLDAIIKKGHQFESTVEAYHNTTVSDPLVSGNSFALVLSMDLTMKERGRVKLDELCVYEVKDGKIISETFYM